MTTIRDAIAWALFAFGLAACATSVPHEAAPRYEGPVIDMHLHAANTLKRPPGVMVCPGVASDLRFDPRDSWPRVFRARSMEAQCADPIVGAASAGDVREETIAALRRYNAVGVLSGEPEALAEWMDAAPGLFIPGPTFSAAPDDPSPQDLAEAFESGELKVFAEITAQYRGIKANDPRLAPYWAMAAERDVPVGIHLGSGPPGAPHLYSDFVIQSPLSLEDVLKRHPTLRVYAMHAGFPFIDDLKAMLFMFPQLHLDTGVLQIAATREDYYSFLEELVEAGFIDRIMFGSDQMNWPGLIEEGIEAINDAPFLTYEQKKMILHDNAARFLRLEGE